MLQLEGKHVGVTGAGSMIGRAVVDQLWKKGALPFSILHPNYDLLDYKVARQALVGCDYVIHCAGYNGNLAFNAKYPADIFFNTAQMGLNVLRAALAVGVKKVVTPLASCAYPDTDILVEAEFLNGAPNPTVEAHGLSKRVIHAYGRQLKKQYGFNAVSLIFNTCYGPYDSFNVEKTKVVGGLIAKFCEAVKNGTDVICWGSGEPRRELIYVDDAAKAIIAVLENYDDSELPINIGQWQDVSIKALAELIAELTGFNREIIWDTTKPDGQYQKLLNPARSTNILPHMEFTPLQEGLKKTIEWYRCNLV